MEIVAGTIILLASLLGLAITLTTLSGAWLIVVVAGLCWWWQPELYWWPLYVSGVLLAASGDLAELFSSAVGVKKLGGGRAGAWVSVIGAIIGAIVGTPLIPVPIVGTIVGAVIGAGIGAVVGEKGIAGKGWGRSAKIGAGAAAGRAVSVIVKSALTALCGAILTIAAFV